MSCSSGARGPEDPRKKDYHTGYAPERRFIFFGSGEMRRAWSVSLAPIGAAIEGLQTFLLK